MQLVELIYELRLIQRQRGNLPIYINGEFNDIHLEVNYDIDGWGSVNIAIKNKNDE